MKTLSVDQVSLIEERLLFKYKIKYEDFRNEIVDHIACEIEEEMDEGVSFEDAYEKIRINWNPKLISADKGLFKGIPQLIKNQLDTDFKKIEWKLNIIGYLVAFGIAIGSKYIGMNLIMLYSSLPLVMGFSVLLTYKQVKNLNDYRFDYFKRKALFILSQSVVFTLLLLFFSWLWNKEGSTDVYLGGIVLYSFFMNCYLLIKFYKYFKHGRLNISF
ncbi:MAG: hypothetical protein LBE34_08590 [Flavobacteriaceae bacterium]|jgi:hypothetical protein|nr:hypothetical protein [Flavobacteriaceae bacterium]